MSGIHVCDSTVLWKVCYTINDGPTTKYKGYLPKYHTTDFEASFDDTLCPDPCT